MTSKSFKIMLGVSAVVGIALGLSRPLHPFKTTPLDWSMGKLGQVGEACKLYADQHGGSYPSTSADLGNGWTNFVYMAGLTKASPSNAILAFVPPGRFPKDNRGLILYADLHVELATPDQFIRKFNESQRAMSTGTGHVLDEQDRKPPLEANKQDLNRRDWRLIHPEELREYLSSPELRSLLSQDRIEVYDAEVDTASLCVPGGSPKKVHPPVTFGLIPWATPPPIQPAPGAFPPAILLAWPLACLLRRFLWQVKA